MRTLLFSLTFAILAAPGLATADQVISDDLIVTGNICVGSGACADGEVFGNPDIKIKSSTPSLQFASINVDGPIWSATVGDIFSGSARNFSINDETSNTYPLVIEEAALNHSLHIGQSGHLGLGTSLPAQELHIVGESTPAFRIEQTGVSPYIWDIRANGGAFFLQDVTGGTSPFVMDSGAPSQSISVQSSGDVGLGTRAPEGKLHTYGDGVQLAYFESGDGDAVQVRFRTNSENRRFLAVDNANNVKTQMQFRDNSIVFLGEIVAQEWLNISAAGITTAGPTCNPNPCDATFDPKAFIVPPIAERAARMWEQRHLPAIGPTTPEIPINLTEKMGGVIHELEVAHIYIEQLHKRLEAQEAQLDRLDAQAKMIGQLNSKLEQLKMR